MYLVTKTIGLSWQIAITSFVILLPFCYFLQALLNVKSISDERISRILRIVSETSILNILMKSI